MGHAVNGKEVLSQVVTFDTLVSDLVEDVCKEVGSRENREEVKLCSGSVVLDHRICIGQCIVPSRESPVELTLVRRPAKETLFDKLARTEETKAKFLLRLK